MKRQIIIILVLTGALLPGQAQSWKHYPYVPEGSVFSFPADEGRHPDEAVEWWYMAGHVKGLETGTNYSFMLAYFAYPYGGFEGFRILDISNDDTGDFYTETLPLVYLELGLDTLNIQALLINSTREYWTTRIDSGDHLVPFEYDISATGANGSINFGCISLKPPIFVGDSGLFNQGAHSYTYYYSQTMNEITGTISIRGVAESVEGTAWIDRQFGGFNQVTDEVYEWFSVQLSNGTDLNIWNIFTGDNLLPDSSTYKHITVSPDPGSQFTTTDFQLERLAFHYMPDSLKCYAWKWRLTSPVNQLDLTITVQHLNQEVPLPFRFFEGSTTISGTVSGEQVTGKGFAELLKNYEDPRIRMNDPGTFDGDDTGRAWNGDSAISWHLLDPDDGRPVTYDLEFSTDRFEHSQILQAGLSDTLFYWNDPPLNPGDSCWFSVFGYSIDTTLSARSAVSEARVYVPNNTGFPSHFQDQNPVPFRIYPNPAGKVLHIAAISEEQSFAYQIFDLEGRMVQESGPVTGTSAFSIAELAPGPYIIRIRSGSGLYPLVFQVVK